MIHFLRILWIATIILCGCAKHHERNTFESEIKTYTYEEALEASQDPEGFYNFFLLPDISSHQAYAFEQKLAESELAFGYNVYTGADAQSVEVLVSANVPVELFAAYIETVMLHIQGEKPTKPSTFRAAIAKYLTLRKAIQMSTPKKEFLYIDRVLFYLLKDNDQLDVGHRINYAYRLLDRVKFHMYKKKIHTFSGFKQTHP